MYTEKYTFYSSKNKEKIQFTSKTWAGKGWLSDSVIDFCNMSCHSVSECLSFIAKRYYIFLDINFKKNTAFLN